MKAVFNSSPIIILSKFNILEETFNIFNEVIIPEMVFQEIAIKDDKIYKFLNEKKDLIKKTNLKKLYNYLRFRLGKGEAEAIAIGIENNIDFVILDDLVARKVAMQLGLKVKGSLAIIKYFLQKNKVQYNSLDDLYQKIIKYGFRIHKKIFLKIFEEKNDKEN